MTSRLKLALYIAGVLACGLLIGFTTQPAEWYAGLAKPSFNPPNWLFAPVWTVLYVVIAIAGWRVSEKAEDSGLIRLWWLQLALNFLWSPAFFGLHWIGAALVVILLLLGAIIAFTVRAWTRDRLSAWLFTPYALWVAFASMLNAAIWTLN